MVALTLVFLVLSQREIIIISKTLATRTIFISIRMRFCKNVASQFQSGGFQQVLIDRSKLEERAIILSRNNDAISKRLDRRYKDRAKEMKAIDQQTGQTSILRFMRSEDDRRQNNSTLGKQLFLKAQIRLMGINHQRNRTRFPPNPSLDATPPISNVSSCIAAASAAAFYEHRCLLWDFVGMLVHPRAHQRSSPSVSLTQLAFDHDWWAAGWVQAQKLLLAETIN